MCFVRRLKNFFGRQHVGKRSPSVTVIVHIQSNKASLQSSMIYEDLIEAVA